MQYGTALTIVFGKPRGQALVREAHRELTLEDGRLTADGAELAVHADHIWVAGATRYSRFDIEQPVDLQLRSNGEKSRQFGPYRHFSCVDGVAYVEQRIFAFYDSENRDWYVFDDGKHWKTVVITAASRALA